MILKTLVGSRWTAIAAIVLAVGLISYFTIQYIQKGERDSITIELQEKTIEKRKEVRDAVNKGVGSTSRSDDAADSLRFLRDRQGAQ